MFRFKPLENPADEKQLVSAIQKLRSIVSEHYGSHEAEDTWSEFKVWEGGGVTLKSGEPVMEVETISAAESALLRREFPALKG